MTDVWKQLQSALSFEDDHYRRKQAALANQKAPSMNEIAKKRSTTVWKKLNEITKHAYPTGNINSITDRFYGAKCNWTNIAKITNSLIKPNHYKDENTVIQRVLEAKGCQTTTEDYSASDVGGTQNITTDTGSDTSQSGGSSSTSNSNKEDDGNDDLTYDDIIHSIASAIDAHYYIVDDVLYFISFNVLFAGGYKETGFPDIPITIDYWMQEDGTLDLDISQYGMYNTIVLYYKNGYVKVQNEDLVRIYGEVTKYYNDKSIESYYAARLKAQALLSAHIRDFGMEVKVSTLYTGKLHVGQYIRLKNPLTMTENLYYIYGLSISWDAKENTFKSDLSLRYGPENPDNPIIPETGTGGYYPHDGDNSQSERPQSVSQASSKWTDASRTYVLCGETGGGLRSTARVKYKCNKPTDEGLNIIPETLETVGRADTNYGQFALKYKGNPTGLFKALKKMHTYSSYADNRHANADVTFNGGRGIHANCGDSARLIKCCMDVIGVPCYCIHSYSVGRNCGHYYNAVQLNGKWYSMDLTSECNSWK